MFGLNVSCSAHGNASPSGLVPALEKLAAEDNAEAMYHLGMAYHTASGVSRDYAKALKYFRAATRLGNPLGAYKVGCYYSGQGDGQVEDDIVTALKYKLIAAEAGYALAQQDVAKIYFGQRDFNTALMWLEKAVAQGWAGALMTYASIHNGAPGIRRAPVTTAAYFRLFVIRTEASKTQENWLMNFEEKLTAPQTAQAQRIVSGYQSAPTNLSRKALSGQSAAMKLVNLFD